MRIFCICQKSSKHSCSFWYFLWDIERKNTDLCFHQMKSLLRYFLTWSFSCDNFIFKLITKLLLSSYDFWYLSVLWRNEDDIFIFINSYAIDTFLEALPWAIESTMNFILHLIHTLYYYVIKTTDLKMAALCNSIKYS